MELDHKNIVKYYQSQIINDRKIDLILEWVPGGSLRSLLNEFGKFDQNLELVSRYTL